MKQVIPHLKGLVRKSHRSFIGEPGQGRFKDETERQNY